MERRKLRMPIFSYFLAVGTVLTGLLLWFGDGEAIGTVHTASQTVGIPKFKPEPDADHARATAANFAAEYRRPERNLEAPSPRQKPAIKYSKPRPLGHFAEFPYDNLGVH
jgi:hypothetical protein